MFVSQCDCIKKVRTVRDQLNSNWKNYINSCAKFTGGDPTLERGSFCSFYSTSILVNEKYVLADGTNVEVPLTVLESANNVELFVSLVF